MIGQTKRRLLLTLAAAAIALAVVGGYAGWHQVDAQVAEICNNGIDDNSDGKTDCVLILGTTVTGSPSPEQLEAEALFFEVHVDSAAAWGARSTASFARYRAIILGDPENPANNDCFESPTPIAAAEANRATWTPAITGGVAVIGTDPIAGNHGGDVGNTVGKKLIRNSIKFAGNVVGNTGAVIVLSCYYHTAPTGTAVPVLDQFGSFTVIGGNLQDAHITDATHPVVTDPFALTDADLDNWGNSIHARFETMPATFSEVAESQATGLSYIIVRGPNGQVFTDTKTVSPNQPSVTYDRGDGYFARYTFENVITPFQLEFTFMSVPPAVENARLANPDGTFPPGTMCIPSDDLDDDGGCIRHSARCVGGCTPGFQYPQQGVQYSGMYTLELGFHANPMTIQGWGMAQAFKGDTNGDGMEGDQVQSLVDFYDAEIGTALNLGSCNCVGVAETDGFSDYLNISIPLNDGGTDPIYTLLPPIRVDGTSVIKSGRALPVKFSLTDGPGGPPIVDAIAVLGVKRNISVGDNTLLTYEEILADARGPSTGNQFSYNAATGEYELVVDTKGWESGALYKGTIIFQMNPDTLTGPYLAAQTFTFGVKQ